MSGPIALLYWEKNYWLESVTSHWAFPTHLTSFPPWANDPKVAVRICKNENNLLTFSSSTAWFFEALPELPINGTLLEFAEMFALTLVWFMPSRLMPLSTFSRQCLAVVVVILLFLVDVIRSLVPALRMMFGGSVRSLTESFLPSWPSPLSLCSESGGDGVVEINLGGDKVLFLKQAVLLGTLTLVKLLTTSGDRISRKGSGGCAH